MRRGRTRTIALALLTACIVLAAATAAAQAPRSPTPLPEGPGGRSRLSDWTLRRDPRDIGLRERWQRGGFPGATVSVPNVVNPTPYSGLAAEPNYEGSVAWYRTSFRAPTPGEYALTFESANFQANVWVDGHEIASHRGSYLPFEPRARVGAGVHTVVVRVDWRDPAEQSRLGFHRTWFNWGGLDGEAYVREVGASEISSPSIETTLTGPSAAGGATPVNVAVSAVVRNNGAAGRTIALEGTLARGGQRVALPFPAVQLGHGQSATVRTTVAIPEAALWSPASPALYDMTLAVPGESSFSASVGLRQLTWHGGRIYLNGRRLLLHGATVQEDAIGHGDALTSADDDRIVSELRAIGANAVRSQHPLYPALLERLDAAGIMVWQGVGPVEGAGNWYSTTPALLGDAEDQVRTAVSAAQLHPSIFAWNLVDEVAENGRDSAEVQYVETMARWLHQHDPTRLVAVDVWGDHPPQRPGALYRYADAVAETDYSGWYDNPTNPPAAVSAEINRRLAAMQRTFAGKVLVISEFGAESNDLNRSGSPGSYSYQASLLARHIRSYEADPALSAMFIWLLRDYPLDPTFSGGSIHTKLPNLRLIESLNQKGLYTYPGTPKPAAPVVAHMYRALGPW